MYTYTHTYNEILLSNEKEWTTDTPNNTDEAQKHYCWVKSVRHRVHTERLPFYEVLEKENIYSDSNQISDHTENKILENKVYPWTENEEKGRSVNLHRRGKGEYASVTLVYSYSSSFPLWWSVRDGKCSTENSQESTVDKPHRDNWPLGWMEGFITKMISTNSCGHFLKVHKLWHTSFNPHSSEN